MNEIPTPDLDLAALADRLEGEFRLDPGTLSPEQTIKLIEGMTEGATVLLDLALAAVGVLCAAMPVNGLVGFPMLGPVSAGVIPQSRMVALHNALVKVREHTGAEVSVDPNTLTPFLAVPVDTVAARMAGVEPMPEDGEMNKTGGETASPEPEPIPRVLRLEDDPLARFKMLGTSGQG